MGPYLRPHMPALFSLCGLPYLHYGNEQAVNRVTSLLTHSDANLRHLAVQVLPEIVEPTDQKCRSAVFKNSSRFTSWAPQRENRAQNRALYRALIGPYEGPNRALIGP